MEKETLQQIQVLVPEAEPSELTILPADPPTWRDSYTQITGACIAHMLTIQVGINMALSAILLPRLNHPDTEIRLEPGEGTWFASLVTISLPIGSILSGPLMDRYGRKNVSLFTCIPYLVSWILIYWSYNVVWLYVARILAGMTAGVANVAVIYTSETTNPVWRPMLLGLNGVFVSFGILLTGLFGAFFYWRTIAVIFAVMTTLIFFLVSTLPESPHWLLSFGNGTRDSIRLSEARKSIKQLNRNDAQAEREFNQLVITYHTNKAIPTQRSETLKQKFQTLTSPEVYKPIILLAIIYLFQQASGSYVIIFYAVDLFKGLGGDFGFLDEYTALVAMGLLRLIMAVVAFTLSRRFGRRPLCIVSGFGMSVSMLVAWILMGIDQFDTKIPTLVCIMLFVCCAAIGWQTIPWSLTGELLPTKARAIAGGIMVSYAYLLMFIAVQSYPTLKLLIDLKGVFLMYSICSFTSIIFVWKYLPETFGRTLIEIEQFFK